jgi:arylsulfatase A-like enzyme
MHFLGSRLNRGFRFYEEPQSLELEWEKVPYRRCHSTLKNAMIWLDNFPADQPLFMWIHLFDPHMPYRSPESYVDQIVKDMDQNDFLNYLSGFGINHELYVGQPQHVFNLMNRYDAEIRYVDTELQEFYGFVESRLPGDNLWVITSDHGEALGQHNFINHAFLIYQELVHVPLIFHRSGGSLRPALIPDVVENFDIYSTLLEAAAISPDKARQREVQSISLWQKIHDPALSLAKKTAFSEREQVAQTRPDLNELERGVKFGLQDSRFKYIFWPGRGDEFFDLLKDPHETVNRLADPRFTRERDNLKKELLKMVKILSRFQHRPVRKTDKVSIERLKELGYL